MPADDKLARSAGLIYLIIMPATGLAYSADRLIGRDEAAVTLADIEANRTLLEMANLSGAAGFVGFLVLGLLLYRLFNPVSKGAATFMLAFIAASVPLSLIAVARRMDVVSLLDAGQGMPALEGDQLAFQVMAALSSAENLFLTSMIFWGLWLIPLGWLVFRSGFMPRMLGILLMLGSFYYVLLFAGSVLNPGYEESLFGRIIAFASGIPSLIGELGTCLWLLIKGVQVHKPAESKVTSASTL